MPEEHLGPVVDPAILVVDPAILVVDRDKAYQAIDKVKCGLIVLAFCWRMSAAIFSRWRGVGRIKKRGLSTG